MLSSISLHPPFSLILGERIKLREHESAICRSIIYTNIPIIATMLFDPDQPVIC